MSNICVCCVFQQKISSFQNEQKHFKQVIDACLQAIANVNTIQLSQAENQAFIEPPPTKQSISATEFELIGKPPEFCAEKEAPSISTDIDRAEVQCSQAIVDTREKKKLHDKNSEIISTNSSAKDVGEEDDYSYMYIMKTESKELAEVKKEIKDFSASIGNNQFNAEYISLSIVSNAPSSLRTQKGHFLAKQKKLDPSPDVKSASLASNKPKAVVLNSGTVSTETKIPGQQKDNFIPFTETRALNSQSVICNTEAKEVDVARITTLPEEAPFEAPLFTISRAGDSAAQSKTAETTQRPVQENNRILTASEKIEMKDLPEGKSETPLFSLCRSGNAASHTQVLTKRASQQTAENDKEDQATLGAQELRASASTKYKGIDFLSLVEPSKDAKKATKRKLQSDKSYISFAYTESNIQTMVSNPSKKKKKKKQKK